MRKKGRGRERKGKGKEGRGREDFICSSPREGEGLIFFRRGRGKKGSEGKGKA